MFGENLPERRRHKDVTVESEELLVCDVLYVPKTGEASRFGLVLDVEAGRVVIRPGAVAYCHNDCPFLLRTRAAHFPLFPTP